MDAMSKIFKLGARDRRRAAEQTARPERAAMRQIKCHTTQRNFAPKLLKTNDRHPNKVTHFFEPALTIQASRGGLQEPHAA
jgi:hypothetical protein